MTYDYFTINFTSFVGFCFLLIFLYANASLDKQIKQIFYLTIFLEFIEAVAYSLELWTTTFATLSPLRLWLSAIGYSVRPFIFCMVLMLAMRDEGAQKWKKWVFLPAVINMLFAFSVFFTDLVYSYTPANEFMRGPLGFMTHFVVVLYLIVLIVVAFHNHANHPKLEVMIIFAICGVLVFSMAVEAIFLIRTVGRASLIMVTIFYYMFFQTQVHRDSITKEQGMRQQLEHSSRVDGSTGVLNKKAFRAAAEVLLSEENKQNLSSLGFLFVDLDHLKELNDSLGHATGDIAIFDAARAIQGVFRDTDLVGRFGGDEFCVLVPNIPLYRFQAGLEELLQSLRKEYSANSVSVTVTASMGAIYAGGPVLPGLEHLLYLSDVAMYEAKSAGRNCYVLKEL